MASWLEALALHERDGTPAVLVTVLDISGSAPREPGAKLVVARGRQDGTIGGGALEHHCIAIAEQKLRGRDTGPLLREFPLGPALGQCCGGRVRVLFEPMFTHAWPIALFGAGHVGQAITRLLAELPCRLCWVDTRPGQFPAALPPHLRAVASEAPEAEVAGLAPGSAVLVMTHDHALDYRIAMACLRRDDLGFVGMIGSATKATRFRSRLARDGLLMAAIARLVCPIGVSGAGGKLPAEIAIAVVAQLLQVRDAMASPAIRTVPDEACAACQACTLRDVPA